METGNENQPNDNPVPEMDSQFTLLYAHLAECGLAGANLVLKLKSLHATTTQLKMLDEFYEKLKSAKAAEDVGLIKEAWKYLTSLYNNFASCKETTKILNTTDMLTDKEVQKIIQEVNKTAHQLAENQVQTGALASGILFTVQIHLLRNIWAELANAENVGDEAKGLDIQTITSNMEELKASAKELTDWLSQYDYELRSARNQLLRRIQMKVSRMSMVYNDTSTKIFKLGMKIDGQIVKLGNRQEEMTSFGIMNVANGFAQLIQMKQVSGLIGSGYMALQAGVTATFFGLASANVYTHHVTGKTVVRLRAILSEIRALDVEIKGVQKMIREAEDFVTAMDSDDQVSVYRTLKTCLTGDTNSSKGLWLSLLTGVLMTVVYALFL